MLEPVRVLRDLSVLLAHSGAVREWVSPHRLVDRLRQSNLAEDPLAFMEAPEPMLFTLKEQEVSMFRKRMALRTRPPASAEVSAFVAAPGVAPEAPETPERVAPVIDARARFEARARASRMVAVESDEDLFGPQDPILLRPDLWVDPGRAAAAPLRLSGEAVALWYRVELSALRSHLSLPPAPLFGRGLIGVCLSRYKHLEPVSAAEREDRLVELTVVGLCTTPEGPRFMPMSRLVDPSSRSPGLRALACQRPRELAYITIDPQFPGWAMTARWRSGAERLELAVTDDHWLNRFGLGPLMWLASWRVGWPVGGGRGRLAFDRRQRCRVGQAERVLLPERLHRGLLTPGEIERPLSVTLMPQFQLIVPA